MYLEPGAVLKTVMLWPLRRLGRERDTFGSLMFQGYGVSDVIEREAKEVVELPY